MLRKTLSTLKTKTKLKPNTKTDIFLTKQELKAVLKVADTRNRVLILLAYRKALRVSEVAMLQRSDIDLVHGTIYVTRLKGSISRPYPLLPDEAKLLKRYLKTRTDNEPILFRSRQGGEVHRSQVYRSFKKCCVKAEIPAHKQFFHILKHTIGTHMSDALIPLQLIQKHLGHAQLKNTMIYSKANNYASDMAFTQAMNTGRLI